MESPCHVSTLAVVHDAWVRWKHERVRCVGGGGGGWGGGGGRGGGGGGVRKRHLGG